MCPSSTFNHHLHRIAYLSTNWDFVFDSEASRFLPSESNVVHEIAMNVELNRCGFLDLPVSLSTSLFSPGPCLYLSLDGTDGIQVSHLHCFRDYVFCYGNCTFGSAILSSAIEIWNRDFFIDWHLKKKMALSIVRDKTSNVCPFLCVSRHWSQERAAATFASFVALQI